MKRVVSRTVSRDGPESVGTTPRVPSCEPRQLARSDDDEGLSAFRQCRRARASRQAAVCDETTISRAQRLQLLGGGVGDPERECSCEQRRCDDDDRRDASAHASSSRNSATSPMRRLRAEPRRLPSLGAVLDELLDAPIDLCELEHAVAVRVVCGAVHGENPRQRLGEDAAAGVAALDRHLPPPPLGCGQHHQRCRRRAIWSTTASVSAKRSRPASPLWHASR